MQVAKGVVPCKCMHLTQIGSGGLQSLSSITLGAGQTLTIRVAIPLHLLRTGSNCISNPHCIMHSRYIVGSHNVRPIHDAQRCSRGGSNVPVLGCFASCIAPRPRSLRLHITLITHKPHTLCVSCTIHILHLPTCQLAQKALPRWPDKEWCSLERPLQLLPDPVKASHHLAVAISCLGEANACNT